MCKICHVWSVICSRSEFSGITTWLIEIKATSDCLGSEQSCCEKSLFSDTGVHRIKQNTWLCRQADYCAQSSLVQCTHTFYAMNPGSKAHTDNPTSTVPQLQRMHIQKIDNYSDDSYIIMWIQRISEFELDFKHQASLLHYQNSSNELMIFKEGSYLALASTPILRQHNWGSSRNPSWLRLLLHCPLAQNDKTTKNTQGLLFPSSFWLRQLYLIWNGSC